MSTQFTAGSDVTVRFRTDSVKTYMSPTVQHSKPHFHYLFEILYIVKGSASFVVNEKTYHLHEGSFLFLSNLENHFISSHSDDYIRYSICISNEMMTAYLKSPLLLSIFKQRPEHFSHQYNCTSTESAHYTHMLDIIYQEYQQQGAFWDHIIVSKIMDILVSMYREKPDTFPANRFQENQHTIFNIQNYIESHLKQELTLDIVADQFYINKFYLSHTFKKITGYNFKQYIILERISKSKDLLLNTKMSIQEISLAVGFTNASHFIRSFKGLEKTSPNQYRKGKKPTIT